MNRRGFLSFMGMASVGAAASRVYSFPSIIVPQNIVRGYDFRVQNLGKYLYGDGSGEMAYWGVLNPVGVRLVIREDVDCPLDRVYLARRGVGVCATPRS